MITRGTLVLSCVLRDHNIFHLLHATSDLLVLVQDVKNRVKQDFIPTFVAECLYWPFIQGFNFWKVPVKHQLLVVNTACLADSTFLSW